MSNIVEHHGPVVLVVLDGWGYRPERDGNAIAMASVPNWQRLWGRYPRTLLDASGLAVGLPEGQMGNSEVGHLNLGAGRVVPQDLVRISQSIQSGEFYQLQPLVELGAYLRETGGTLHLVGLLEAGSSLAVLVYFVYSGDGLTSLFLLLPLALGAGITLWGIGMMRRGWAGCRSPAEQAPWIPADPSVPSVSREPLER